MNFVQTTEIDEVSVNFSQHFSTRHVDQCKIHGRPLKISFANGKVTEPPVDIHSNRSHAIKQKCQNSHHYTRNQTLCPCAWLRRTSWKSGAGISWSENKRQSCSPSLRSSQIHFFSSKKKGKISSHHAIKQKSQNSHHYQKSSPMSMRVTQTNKLEKRSGHLLKRKQETKLLATAPLLIDSFL